MIALASLAHCTWPVSWAIRSASLALASASRCRPSNTSACARQVSRAGSDPILPWVRSSVTSSPSSSRASALRPLPRQTMAIIARSSRWAAPWTSSRCALGSRPWAKSASARTPASLAWTIGSAIWPTVRAARLSARSNSPTSAAASAASASRRARVAGSVVSCTARS